MFVRSFDRKAIGFLSKIEHTPRDLPFFTAVSVGSKFLFIGLSLIASLFRRHTASRGQRQSKVLEQVKQNMDGHLRRMMRVPIPFITVSSKTRILTKESLLKAWNFCEENRDDLVSIAIFDP